MPEPWLLVAPGSLRVGEAVALDPGEARHLERVLRRAAGEAVVLTDGAGTVADAIVRRGGRDRLVGEVTAVRTAPPPPAAVRVALGVLHTQAMDWAVQKSVEVGAVELVPVVCERSQLGPQAARGRLAHWRRVAVQALKQCRRAWAMDVAEPVSLPELLDATRSGVGVVAHPGGVGPTELAVSAEALLLVGPEGGFNDAEERALAGASWPRLCLGPYTLRAETAAVVGAALLVARLGTGKRG